jgi:hypothetical protein
MFVGFSAKQSRLTAMFVSMAGADGEDRDALTRYTRPSQGAEFGESDHPVRLNPTTRIG